MDVTISSVAEDSTWSGEKFLPGQRVWSILYLADAGALERMDLHESELGEAPMPEKIVCKWAVVIKEKQPTEADARRAATLGAEELFLQLVEERDSVATPDREEDATVQAARERLVFMLALQLDRRRVLRSVGRGRYLHIKTKRLLTVPDLEITAELVQHLHAERDALPGT